MNINVKLFTLINSLQFVLDFKFFVIVLQPYNSFLVFTSQQKENFNVFLLLTEHFDLY